MHNRFLQLATAAALVSALHPISGAYAYCNKSGTYINSDGHTVKDPRCADDASGAKYLCGDGSYSFSEHRQGACSRHGGVAKSLQ